MRATLIQANLCAAVLAAPLMMAQPTPAAAATRQVSNCNDSGPGSLRAAAASAASGDSIDLRGLACGRITLVTGQIYLPQDDIALIGPGRLAMTVSGNRIDRVIEHGGNGTLRIQGLSLAYGYLAGPSVFGACVLSTGRVELRHARVHHCDGQLLHALEPDAGGAGVAAVGSILLSYSSVFANRFFDADFSLGGGVFSSDRLVMDHSQLYDNAAGGGGGGYARTGASLGYSIVQNNVASSAWGGLATSGHVVVNKSTISGNQSRQCGGLCVGGGTATVIVDSTISGNAGVPSAVQSTSDRVDIYNSTIVRNAEPGLTCTGAIQATNALRMQSSIAAANTCGVGAGPDIGALSTPSARIVGAGNLIGLSLAPTPVDTLVGDPRIAPLAWNGGPTRTHALLSDSPARDRGNNVLHRQYDQRGPGFPRTKGAGPDIGAYER